MTALDALARYPLWAVRETERRHPRLWERAEAIKESAGEGKWPQGCWLPLAGWAAALGGDIPMLAFAAAAGTWRLSRGVYVFDGDFAGPLTGTPLPGTMPVEVFRRLPEYCVYIDMTERRPESVYSGFFAYLEYDARESHSELRLVFLPRSERLADAGGLILHIDRGSLMESLRGVYGATVTESIIKHHSEALSMLMYLCSDGPDYGDRTPPAYREPRRVKGRRRWIAPQKPTQWTVGVRIGAAIRAYRAEPEHGTEREDKAPTGRTVRPHIRRAHWHGFWTGPRREAEARKFVYHWIPPVEVNLTPTTGDLPAVVHRARGKD